jgi:hypothetical protein
MFKICSEIGARRLRRAHANGRDLWVVRKGATHDRRCLVAAARYTGVGQSRDGFAVPGLSRGLPLTLNYIITLFPYRWERDLDMNENAPPVTAGRVIGYGESSVEDNPAYLSRRSMTVAEPT